MGSNLSKGIASMIPPLTLLELNSNHTKRLDAQLVLNH